MGDPLGTSDASGMGMDIDVVKRRVSNCGTISGNGS